MLNALKKMIGMTIIASDDEIGLRSVREMAGYRLIAPDEPTGHYGRRSYSRSDRHEAR